jgi:hypothetical protein
MTLFTRRTRPPEPAMPVTQLPAWLNRELPAWFAAAVLAEVAEQGGNTQGTAYSRLMTGTLY